MQRITTIDKMALNQEQQNAVFADHPELLVLAGAGTGKTRVLTARVCHLLETGASPREIHCFTFTNKAAGELRKRLRGLIVSKYNRRVGAGTFHSFYFHILDEWATKINYRRGISIFDEQDKRDVIAQVCDDLGYKKARIFRALDSHKDETASTLVDVATVMEEYRHRLRTYNCIDYDLLQDVTVEMLETHPEVLAHVRRRARHILVDEYQDTDQIQARFLELLRPASLFIVGDDYQAIYGWRGADFRILLNFKRSHADAEEYILKKNYRSTAPIIEAANRLIKFNKERTEKTIVSANGKKGEPLMSITSEDSHREARAISQVVQKIQSAGHELKDITILARTNEQIIRIIEHGLKPNRIPVQALIADRAAWSTRAARGICYFFRAFQNPRDIHAQSQIINFPFNRLDLKTMSYLRRRMALEDLDLIQAARKYCRDTPGVQEFIETFFAVASFNDNERPDAYRLVKKIDRKFGISETLQRRGLRGRLGDLEDFLNRIRIWVKERKEEEEVDARAFLGYMVSLSLQDSLRDDNQAVRAMTVHSAKGLEFPIVIIAGAVEGVFPHALALRDGDLEEERRLFYVAMTRAQEVLVLSSFQLKINDFKPWARPMPVPHSRFMDEALGRPQIH